jgi:molybdopterin-guanine dinucleotide biosynthesis protein A
MGGVAKPRLEVGGRRLLDIALDALAGARQRVVVGDVAVPDGVLVTREEPPGAGPVAALAAALPLVESDLCVVLAADLPFVTREHVAQLVSAADDRSAVAVDTGGRAQPLLAAYHVGALRAALPDDVDGAPMRALRVETRSVRLDGDPWFDVDHPADLETARSRTDG